MTVSSAQEPARSPTESPRVVERLRCKRNEPLTWRSYGHWWIEIDGDESYGWWPASLPVRVRDVFGGCNGVLNAVDIPGSGGTATRDPNHGVLADHVFHPVLVEAKTDEALFADIRAFAHSFAGPWQWSTRPTMNCRTFQLALFDAVGVVDGTGNYTSRGTGCPALTPARRLAATVTGKRYWPGNLPEPGRRVADVFHDSRPGRTDV